MWNGSRLGHTGDKNKLPFLFISIGFSYDRLDCMIGLT
ncbi:hydrogen peroxide-inducible genes activator, partial [Mesorhizobium sp. M8A.F.Ca.ET.023.02.2.1]